MLYDSPSAPTPIGATTGMKPPFSSVWITVGSMEAISPTWPMSIISSGRSRWRRSILLRVDERAVLAGEAHGLAAGLIDQGDDVLVHRAAQHHLDHVHGLGVGDAHALHELALLADAG